MLDKQSFPWGEVQNARRINLFRWAHELTGVELKSVNGAINEDLVIEVVEKLMNIIFSNPDNTGNANENSGNSSS